MQHYHHNENLKFDYPDDWTGRYDDGLILFLNKEATIGALQFTVFYPPEKKEVSLKDWLEEQLVDYYTGFTVMENKHYAHSRYIISDGRCWRHWAIRKDDMVLYGTYNCDESSQGIEDKIVDAIIDSIFKMKY
ncbi:hypothetical protein [Chitinophaga sp. S165]|uniref:hypothetical protein n=1 Tax=Chitinophaga sp. S165 TaxID=2135462 RepID=UPI000D7117CA|nr:hypothetical protein [Chitinophaga sp. S165]PWV48341.1 hypothetical protein C7475_107249 [Chitinophaga sp. S165]